MNTFVGHRNGVAGLRRSVLIYHDNEQYLAHALPFLRDGVARGERVVVVTNPANVDLLTAELGPDAKNIGFADATAWFASSGRTCAAYHGFVAELVADGHNRARVLAEATWSSRLADEVNDWIRFESVVDVLFAPAPMDVICCYDARTAAAPGTRCRCPHPQHRLPGLPLRTQRRVPFLRAVHRPA